MEQQQHGFRDLTPRAGSDRLQKSAKSLLSALQLMSISYFGPKSMGQVISTSFEAQEKLNKISKINNHLY